MKGYPLFIFEYHKTNSGFDTRSDHIRSFFLPLLQEGHLSVIGESMCTKYGGLSLSRKSVARLSDRPDMTIAVYRTTQHNILDSNYYLWISKYRIIHIQKLNCG